MSRDEYDDDYEYDEDETQFDEDAEREAMFPDGPSGCDEYEW